MEEKKRKKSSPLGLIWGFSRGARGNFVAAVVFSLVSIVLSSLVPQVIRITVDSIIGDYEFALPQFVIDWIEAIGGREMIRTHLIFCAAGIVVFSALSGLCNYGSRMNIMSGTEKVVKSMRDRLFSHVQRLPFAWHVMNQTGDIIQRCTSDVEVIRNFISGQLLEVVRTVILITVSLFMLFRINGELAFIVAAFIPFVMLYSGFFFSKIAKNFMTADEAEGDLTVDIQENLTGVRVVRAFGRERYEVDKFDKKNNFFADLWIRVGKLFSAYWSIGDLVMMGQILTMIVLGAIYAANGKLSIGEFTVFITYVQTIAWPVRALGRVISEMSKTGVSVERLREILDADEEPAEPEATKPDLNQTIRFDHVTFGYENAKVLKDVSFDIKPGTVFGILGSTGSGKSTITYLLNRLYDLPENSGEITIGGVNIKKIDREYLRKNVGLVLQEPFLFSKTIFENIRVASDEADLNEVRRNAKIAAVDDSIIGFAQGYDTVVGERGVTLSGGQKQRVAIARTLMLGAPIMIFDDSMSAVDMETDAKIREALRANTGASTVILISHRINTLMHSEKILVLDDGEVCELGTHEELIAKNGIYKRIFDIQSNTGDEEVSTNE